MGSHSSYHSSAFYIYFDVPRSRADESCSDVTPVRSTYLEPVPHGALSDAFRPKKRYWMKPTLKLAAKCLTWPQFTRFYSKKRHFR